MSTNSKNRGRPAFKPTPAQRQQVRLGAAAGLSEEHMAEALGISRDTLRKHFEKEIGGGKAKTAMENLARLETAAKSGNVTAMKHLDNAVRNAGSAKPKGKKEQDQEAADEVAAGNPDYQFRRPRLVKG